MRRAKLINMLAHASSIIMSLIFIFVATKKRKKSSQVTTLGSLNSLAGGNRWKIVRPFGHSLVPLGCSQRLTPLLKECLSLANTILKRNPKRRATIMTKLFPLDFLSKWQTVNSSSSSSHSKWRLHLYSLVVRLFIDHVDWRGQLGLLFSTSKLSTNKLH